MTTWDKAIAGYLLHCRAAETPESTARTRSDHLWHAARRLPAGPWETTADELLGYVAAQSWSRETRRGHRTSLRSFYSWGVGAGLVATSPASELPKVAAAAPRPRPTPDRALAIALAAGDDRTRLMVRLGAQMGLRRGEVALIHPRRDLLEDLQGWSLTVHGKGSKTRLVPVPDDLVGELVHVDGFLFPGAIDGHLSPRWVGRLVADVLPDAWTMHSLRHRFATRFHRATGDVFALQELLGHASPATTRVYVEVDRDRLRAQMVAAA